MSGIVADGHAIPHDSFTTDDKTKRLKVELGSTGFEQGRAFRLAYPIDGTLTALEPKTIKFSSPIDFKITKQEINIVLGYVKFEALIGSVVEILPFNTPVTSFGLNRASTVPAYTPQVVLTDGGTFSGGTVVETILTKTTSNTNKAGTVGAESGSSRELPAGDYYLRFTGLSVPVDAVYYLEYEELP